MADLTKEQIIEIKQVIAQQGSGASMPTQQQVVHLLEEAGKWQLAALVKALDGDAFRRLLG